MIKILAQCASSVLLNNILHDEKQETSHSQRLLFKISLEINSCDDFYSLIDFSRQALENNFNISTSKLYILDENTVFTYF